jgi:hypothetical protein
MRYGYIYQGRLYWDDDDTPAKEQHGCVMRHTPVKDCCEQLGLQVRQTPGNGRREFSATFSVPGVRVYWSVSIHSDYLLGCPRVVVNGVDTHARSLCEIEYLVKNTEPL